ncbi:MAG: hypothetical protein R2851_05405 [Caldilineaceae bacterium]
MPLMAQALARQWIDANAASIPEAAGRFPTARLDQRPLADAVELSPTSDVDLMLVLDGSVPPLKLGKFLCAGVLLEVSYLPSSAVATTEGNAAYYAIAESALPRRHLRSVGAVDRGATRGGAFPQRTWVRVRCEDARQKVLARPACRARSRPVPRPCEARGSLRPG